MMGGKESSPAGKKVSFEPRYKVESVKPVKAGKKKRKSSGGWRRRKKIAPCVKNNASHQPNEERTRR